MSPCSCTNELNTIDVTACAVELWNFGGVFTPLFSLPSCLSVLVCFWGLVVRTRWSFFSLGYIGTFLETNYTSHNRIIWPYGPSRYGGIQEGLSDPEFQSSTERKSSPGDNGHSLSHSIDQIDGQLQNVKAHLSASPAGTTAASAFPEPSAPPSPPPPRTAPCKLTPISCHRILWVLLP